MIGTLPSGWKGPVKLVRRESGMVMVRDIARAPLTDEEKARAMGTGGKFFDQHQGMHRIAPDKLVPYSGPYRPSMDYTGVEQIQKHLEYLHANPVARAVAHSDARIPRSGRARIASIKAAGEPMLNAEHAVVQKDLAKSPASTGQHCKDKLVRVVAVKAASIKAAKYNGDWATHNWGIFSLKYSKGVVMIDHKARESSTVFPSIGAALRAIAAIGMEVIK